MASEAHYDVFIVGGGINGCGLARDAAGRGYKVALAEMNDLAHGTSSASTKLIHGGLRYLEHYAFQLVRESLIERDVLWRIAPHLVQPLRFLLPYHKGLRPAWMLRLGLFIYDHLGGRHSFPKARAVKLTDIYDNPLKKQYVKAFEYSDARVDDARLVIANARDAKNHGADIMTRTKVIAATPEEKRWRVTLHCTTENKTWQVTTSYIANMAGPWMNDLLANVFGYQGQPPVRLVQGSHIIVPALYKHEYAYIFQNADGRIIFAIPYQEDFTLIGTTDADYKGSLDSISIRPEEIDYLCNVATEYFAKLVKKEDIVATYSGVRPLYNDGASKAQEATRDYVLKEMSLGNANLPILNSFGGKITTYRHLTEDAMEYIEKALGPRKGPWTESAPLPGGDFVYNGLQELTEKIASYLPSLDEKTHRRLARSYGTDTFKVFSNNQAEAFGTHFGHGLYEIEVRWMLENEWALHVEDILWRRSKLGLLFNKQQTENLKHFLATRSCVL